ncbi:MAG: DUF4870 domain-containing protein [Nanoarchaeota archaeon]|nr:DUF4870 domain-containing protein [Nanoarchaeota archaeon]
MAKKKARKRVAKKSASRNHGDSKLFAFLATFLGIIGFVIALLFKRDDKYVMFYASQSLIIFIVSIAASIVSGVFGWIPFLGGVIEVALWILIIGLWLISWIYALSGEKKDVPFVGEWARKIRL